MCDDEGHEDIEENVVSSIIRVECTKLQQYVEIDKFFIVIMSNLHRKKCKWMGCNMFQLNDIIPDPDKFDITYRLKLFFTYSVGTAYIFCVFEAL